MIIGIIKAAIFRLKNKNIQMHIVQNIENGVSIKTSNNGTVNIGKGGHFLRNTTIFADGGKIEIGKGVFINENVKVIAHQTIIIGDKCSIGPNVMIYDHDHDYKSNGGFVSESVVIGEGTWIGANAIILRGCKIGKNAVVAAGTVVKDDVMDNYVVYEKREIIQKLYQKK